MLLEIKSISKSFPGVQALDDVSFDVEEGRVHALVGENGAGKTTLMNIVSGILKPDSGEIRLNGEPVEIDTPKNAISLGISMIFQEINLIPNMNIAENIFIDRLPKKRGYPLVNWKKLYAQAEKLLDTVGLHVSPRTKISSLAVGQQQMIQLAKAISRDAKIIIMDEPTASIADSETRKLFEIIKKLRQQKKTVIYISHRLEEIFEIADKVTVLRNGKYIDTLLVKETDREEIVSKMVGKYMEKMEAKRDVVPGNVIFKVKNLTKSDMLKNISFDVKEGEIVGFYGLIGAGRTELALSILGVYPSESGELYLDGKKVKVKSPKDAIRQGIGYLSEDRQDKSIFPIMNIKENITISNLNSYSRLIFPSAKRELEVSKKMVDRLKIRISSMRQKAMNLSGGNQQKVLVSRLLTLTPKVVILDEPTKGIDVGAKAEIHALIEELSERKIGIVFISSDLPEIISFSDRIVVMREGEISGIFPGRGETRQEKLLKAASPI